MKTIQIVGDSKFGGASYLYIEWCRFLVHQGDEVHALTTDPETIKRLQDIPQVRLVTDILIPREISPAANLRAAKKLKALVQKERYHVLHTYSSTPGFVGRFVGKACQVPLVTHHQAGFPASEFAPLHKRLIYNTLESWAVNAATQSICVSHAVREQARQMRVGKPHKYITIRNGIEIAPYAQAPNEKPALLAENNLPPETQIILAAGRLAEQKGLTDLVAAIPLLVTLAPDTPFHILLAGEGPQRPQIEAAIAHHQVQAHITLLGFRNDIPRLVASADIVASPSLWEGLSISIMEAMAAAKPIVTTNILPNAELVDHEKNGLLVPTKDPQAIAQAIARLLKDPRLAHTLGQAAAKKAAAEFTIERMFQETYAFYQAALKR